MNLLLVDDDESIIQAMKRKIHWDALGIREVYTALNIRQAKELLEKLPISVMICDIEMPQGSGLELLEWVRGCGYEIQTIFLTSYADFRYAKRALELQSLNYYLKPVDCARLEQGIREAVEKARAGLQQLTWKKESEYWKRNREHVIQAFFRNLIEENGFETEAALQNAMQNTGLTYQPDTRMIPLWLELYEEKDEKEMGEQARSRLAIEEQARRICGDAASAVYAVWIQGQSFVLLLEPGEEEIPIPALQKAAEQLARACGELFAAEVFLAIGCECGLSHLREAVKRLKKIRADNVMHTGRIVSVLEYENREIPYHLPAITAWEALLQENRSEELVGQVEAYLNGLNEKNQLNQEILKLFRIDMMQLTYARFRKTEVQAYKFLVNETGERLYRQSIDSVKDMLAYVRYLAECAVSYGSMAGQDRSVADKIREYIDRNFTREITRNDLAEIVYLNPDYISRLFKKETGVSISTYLINRRIDMAKELLANSSMPVNVISMHVGYDNYSYFTRVFRENTGYSPIEYRKKSRGGA